MSRKLSCLVALLASTGTASAVQIERVEPTLLFPHQAQGHPLRQLTRLTLNNPEKPLAAVVRITVGAQAPESQDLDTLRTGRSVVDIQVPDIAAPTPVMIEEVDKDGKVLASKQQPWQPGKKWTIFFCAYSRHDLGLLATSYARLECVHVCFSYLPSGRRQRHIPAISFTACGTTVIRNPFP